MKYELRDFQVTAAEKVIKGLRRGARDWTEEQEYTAQSLSAPTGAGKTVIATAVIERLFYGDDATAADEKACVLWVTDDPSLNEQTRRKMLAAASRFTDSQLVTVRDGFHQEALLPGHVYFVNIQKMAAMSLLMRRKDTRKYTLYDTFNNTVAALGGHLVVMLDEAHRGLATAAKETEKQTIVSRFLTGYGTELQPVPVVLGISATPERFNTFVASASTPGRNIRPCEVPVEDVRGSGLLKDKLFVAYPEEPQPGDLTITRLAAERYAEFRDAWEDYCMDEGVEVVAPVLVVQVKDKKGDDASATTTNMVEALGVIQEVLPQAEGRALAHSFGNHAPLEIGKRAVRYIKPENIQHDADVQVVIFKEALTTGWDCPRAEVMVSYRSAAEDTYIAQLIGRMVRTPLARRVSSKTELLNTVNLYLPHYDAKAVAAVLKRLEGDRDYVPPVEVEKNAITCFKNDSVDPRVFDVMADLPTYVIPAATRRSQVARLNAVAALLSGDGLVADALKDAASLLLTTVDARRGLLEQAGEMQQRVDEAAVLAVGTRGVDLGTGRHTETITEKVALAEGNVDDLMKQAQRLLRDGLAKQYWAHRVTGHGSDSRTAKLETYVLATDHDVVGAVESTAESAVASLMNKYDEGIRTLSDVKRQRYYAIQQQARQPEITSLTVFDSIITSGDYDPRASHLYADDTGAYPVKLNEWEGPVLDKELASAGFLAWYRNTGGRRAVAVPYKDGTRWKPLYPDFILFHEIDGEVKPSIVDPHGHYLGDASMKLRGLANYAEQHGGGYHRVDAVIKAADGTLRRLDLKNKNCRSAVSTVAGKEDIEAVFQQFGTAYG